MAGRQAVRAALVAATRAPLYHWSRPMRCERTRGSTSAFVRAAALTALVVPLAVMASACSDAVTVGKASPPPVRIGAIYNLTGGQSALDAPSLDGARLAVERINARGGRSAGAWSSSSATAAQRAEVRRAGREPRRRRRSAIIGLSDTRPRAGGRAHRPKRGRPFVTRARRRRSSPPRSQAGSFSSASATTRRPRRARSTPSSGSARGPPPWCTTRSSITRDCCAGTSSAPSGRRADTCWLR